MENKTALMILFSTLVLSCFFIAQINAKNQIEALSHIYKEKLKINTDIIDNPSHLLDEAINLFQYSQEGLKEIDLIKNLPEQPEVTFNQYGGYVTVNPTAGRAFFYYFAEADRNSSNKLPLLLWLNGGPGCSSLAYGAMIELGPFRVNSDGKTLYINELAWNRVANVLFLESPAGVGFSYSNTTNDTVTNDDKGTTYDNFVFLVNWLDRFPEYKNRDFYIAGESYAGHYVPQLAHIILHQNQKAKKKTIINLKGIIIGNAAINYETDEKGMFEYFESHALISDDTKDQFMKYCDLSPNVTEQSDKCNEAYNEAYKNMGPINIYNIYAPLCSNSNLTDKPKMTSAMSVDPCSDHYVYSYMNKVDVQKALHANVTNIPYDWQPCSDIVTWNWADSPSTVLPLLKEIMGNGLQVWIYSGDIDGRVPVTSTQKSIKEMKLSIKIPWHPWYLDGQVGGYTTKYEGNLTFATVRGAGHEVPSYQPARALSLITHFLAGTELSNSSRNSDT